VLRGLSAQRESFQNRGRETKKGKVVESEIADSKDIHEK